MNSAAAAEVPSLHSKDLARGPLSSMHVLVEKTMLRVDVATLDVRVGRPVQARFADVARAGRRSEALEAELAKVAVNADHAVVQLRFLREVSLQQWIDSAREGLEEARRAGLISPGLCQRVSAGLPLWFKAVRKRGFQRGDRLLYRIQPDSLRSVAVTHDGHIMVDRTDQGADKPRLVLGSYFGPASKHRAPLLKSLLERKN